MKKRKKLEFANQTKTISWVQKQLLYNYFQEEKTDDLSYLFHKNEDWHIDLTSKFILANGTLVKMILKSDINEFIDFKGIDGMYIYHFSKGGFFSKAHGGIYEVSQSGTTSFIGKSEKTKLKNQMKKHALSLDMLFHCILMMIIQKKKHF